MSDKLTLEIDSKAELERLSKIRKGLRHAVNWELGDVAGEAVSFIKEHTLQGQILKKRSGVTYEHVGKWFSKKTGSWWIRPGVGLTGLQNYLTRWVGTEKDFMHKGFEAYATGQDIAKRVDAAAQKFIDSTK